MGEAYDDDEGWMGEAYDDDDGWMGEAYYDAALSSSISSRSSPLSIGAVIDDQIFVVHGGIGIYLS